MIEPLPVTAYMCCRGDCVRPALVHVEGQYGIPIYLCVEHAPCERCNGSAFRYFTLRLPRLSLTTWLKCRSCNGTGEGGANA